jgi:beta-lactamase regulating signal transducer with metallopeptidase domain
MSALTSHLWQSTWFAVAVGLLTLGFRGNRARVRYGMWLCASVKFLLPFSVLIGAGARLPAPSRVPITFERVTVALAQPATFVAVTPRATDWRPAALAAVWCCGFAAILLVRLRGWRRVRAALRASAPMAIAAGVEVRSSPGLLEPGVVGLLRPVLLLPDGIVERLSAKQLEAVLAHELCHVHRRDNLAAGLHIVVEALFWFHPLVSWIGARLVEERERACDEGVLSLGSEPTVYAGAILGVCKLYVESPLACVSGVTGADLKKRIEGIMTNRIGNTLSLTKKLLLMSAGGAALAAPVIMGVVMGAVQIPILHAQRILPPPPPVTTTLAPAATPAQAHRWLTLLFDCGALTAEEQARARAAATQFVQTRLQPTDMLSVMQASAGSVRVLQDFTNDEKLLEAAISSVDAPESSSFGSRLVFLERAASMLGALPGKKALLYFAGARQDLEVKDQVQVQRAIQTAQAADVAFYMIDVRSAAPSADAAAPVQVFEGHSHAALQAAMIPALPGRHAEIRTHPAGGQQGLFVPLDGLSGTVDIACEVRGPGDTVAANLRDAVQAGSTPARGFFFTLGAGFYTAHLVVRERSTGRQFAETISFEVK